jgi:hypothetical protein
MVAILLKIFGCLAPKDYKKIDFPIFWQGRT